MLASRLLIGATLWLALGSPGLVAAKTSWTKVTKPHPGVEVRRGRSGDNKNNVYAALISLCTARIHVASTATASGLATPGSWASKQGLQLAVNGDFHKWDSYCSKPRLYGDAVGNGVRWPGCQNGTDTKYKGLHFYQKHGWIAFGAGWVELSNSGKVKTGKLSSHGWSPGSVTNSIPGKTQALVSGYSQLVIDGKAVTCSSPTASGCFSDRGDMTQRHPRTAMGLSKDRRTFILAVVDGRTSASIGMYGTELAALMQELGAWTAFNLDGGGSSTMWVDGTYINKPSDGGPRAVANHWGIYAGTAGGKPLTPGSCHVDGGCFPTTVPAAANALFKDMPTSWSGYAEAKLLHTKKITMGCKSSPPMYCPRCPIKRRQLVAFLVRAAKISTANPPATPTFSDVPKGAADYALIEAAAKAGITKGCNSAGTKFCPDNQVKRGQGATMVRRAAGYVLVAPAKPGYTDVPSSHTHFKSVETLKDRCVATTCGAGKFCPDDPLMRDQAAIWTVRAFNLNGKNSCLKELCNGKDDDFDGKTDEAFPLLGKPCDGSDSDTCKNGSYTCRPNGSGVRCVNESVTSIAEVCNGKDDDCDGAIDEGCACQAGKSRPCGSGVGICVQGKQTCAAGSWGPCKGAVLPRTEICNGLDDDCDGATDEACVDGGAPSADGGAAATDGSAGLPPPHGDGIPAELADSGCSCSQADRSPGGGLWLLVLAALTLLLRSRRSSPV